MTATSAGLSLVLNIVEYPIALSGYLNGGLPSVLIISTPGIPILFSGADSELNRSQRLEVLFDILKLFEKSMVIYIYIYIYISIYLSIYIISLVSVCLVVVVVVLLLIGGKGVKVRLGPSKTEEQWWTMDEGD
jgi:hypothetical protein